MKHLEQDELALHYFGDDTPAEHAAAAAHLKECAACRADFEALTLTLATVREAQPLVPERTADYEQRVWDNIRAHLPERETKAPWWAWLAQPKRWAVVCAMAAIVIAAFIVGRMTKPEAPQQAPMVAQNNAPAPQPPSLQGPEPKPPQGPDQQGLPGGAAMQPREPRTNIVPVNQQPARERTRDRILLVAVGDHLEKSQMVLMEIANAPANGPIDITDEQQRAEDLVNSNRLYRMTAQEVGDKKLANVLDELERMLIEIAHEPSKVNSDELKDLQRRIEAQGLLFKVRVVGANIRDQKKAGPQNDSKRPAVTEKHQSI